VNRTAAIGELAQDVVSIPSWDGSNPGRVVSVPDFLFACGPATVEGLATGVMGMAGLGRNIISLPSQFSAAFSFPRKSAICLSSSTTANGVVFFGDGPYHVLNPHYYFDVSMYRLIYTPLILNRVSTASASEYFIGVKSIKINGKVVPLNASLLSIDKEGYGGTKISTVDRYTVMETTIYKAVIKAFVRELENVTRVAGVGGTLWGVL
jgi:hypothetical protein